MSLPHRSSSAPTSAVRALELGAPLPSSLTLRAELTYLTNYHVLPRSLNHGFRPHPITSAHRNSYVVSITSTSDGTLQAILSSSGRIEVHELSTPLDTTETETGMDKPLDTHRLTVHEENAAHKLTCGVFFENSDSLAASSRDASLSHPPSLHVFDPAVCELNTPTTSKPIRYPSWMQRGRGIEMGNGLCDLQTSQWPVASGVRQHQLCLFDMRVHGSAAVVQTYIPCMSPALAVDRAAAEHLRFVAEGCHVLAYDVRRLPSTQQQQQLSSSKHGSFIIAPSAATSASTLVMGATNTKNQQNQQERATAEQLHLAKRGIHDAATLPAGLRRARFNWIRPVPQAAPGLFAFHTSDGLFGMLDWVSRDVLVVPEDGPAAAEPIANVAGGELSDYGTYQASLNASAWYVRKRKGLVVPAFDQRGFRAVVPNVKRPGVRLISVEQHRQFDKANVHQFPIDAAAPFQVSCAAVVNSHLDRMIFGTVANDVVAMQVDFNKSWQKVMERRRAAR